MHAFLTTTDNDLTLVTNPTSGKKNLSIVTDAIDAGVAKLYRRFQFFEGEWFLDTRLGIPYFKYVFVKNPDMTIIRRLFRKVIMSVDIVASIESLDVNYDAKTRAASFSFVALTAEGRVIQGGTGKPFIVDGRDINRENVP